MNEATIILNAEGVEKRFCARRVHPIEVLHGVDLSLAAGERVAIVGRSGSGKSSLLHVLAGLDDVIRAGYLSSANQWLLPITTREPRSGENIWALYISNIICCQNFSALENVALPLRLNGLSQPIAEQQSRELDRIGLGARLQHLPGQLSGGERQRVAVARL